MKKTLTLVAIIAAMMSSCNKEEDFFYFPKGEYSQEVIDDSIRLYKHNIYRLIDEHTGLTAEKVVKKYMGTVASKKVDTIEQNVATRALFGKENESFSQKAKHYYIRHTPEKTMTINEENWLDYRCDSALAQEPYFSSIRKAIIFLEK